MIFALLLFAPDSPEAAFAAVAHRWAGVQSVSGKIEKRFLPKPPDPPAEFSFVIDKSGTYHFDSKDVSTFFDGETYYYLDTPNTLYYRILKSDPGMAPFVAKPSLRTLYALYGWLGNEVEKPESLSFGCWEGKRSLVATFKGDNNFGATQLTAYYDLKTDSPLAVVEGDRLASIVYEYRDLQENVPTEPTQFKWTPPFNFRRSQYELEALLPLHSSAPDLVSAGPTGKRLSLAEAFHANKVTLLEFWFYHCPPCMRAFAPLETLYEKNRGQGLGMLAVNYSDSPGLVRQFLKNRHFEFPVIMSGTDDATNIVKAFKVTAFPTTYAIDQDGKILARWVGIDDPKNFADMEQTLRTAGVPVTDK